MSGQNKKPEQDKAKWILERPDDRNTIRIVGNVYTTMSDDDFLDEFIEWLESKGWSFFGRTVELSDEDDDSEILDGILPEGTFDGTETE
ncbi:hypothetical protein [Alicyclobacillus acidiphilus]|uniref:hypothetical protein n=1 Tax=Alicyclobacillus acidiphilus TaxID=182455 RepID=UPI0008329FDC|nr:hypothetical protein [Alicyclobacillus acidiphilus]